MPNMVLSTYQVLSKCPFCSDHCGREDSGKASRAIHGGHFLWHKPRLGPFQAPRPTLQAEDPKVNESEALPLTVHGERERDEPQLPQHEMMLRSSVFTDPGPDQGPAQGSCSPVFVK